MKNYIWLFSENLSETANNNSYFFWKHVVNKKNSGISKYLILEKNNNNKKIYKKMNKKEKKYVIWRNSLKHFYYYKKADMYFVTLSYRDIRPERFFFKKYDFSVDKPLIYLQHGTLLIKKIGYTGQSYNNNLFRFLYYNKEIKDTLIDENDFRKYQLYYGRFHPRYKELVRKNNIYIKSENKKNQILWFITWREYEQKSLKNKIFIKKINNILCNEELNKYLRESNTKLKLCIHHLYKNNIESLLENVDISNIQLVYARDINLMDEIVYSKLLVTDYSSLGFDFTFLKKPVILFQPDRDDYLEKREIYCSLEELEKYSIDSSKEFIDKIVNEEYGINELFNSRIEDNINYDDIEKGKHIDRMYKYFKNIQENKITFLGYNFYGVGGTVSATKALAEGLLEKGYMVELLSLKKANDAKNTPYALNMKYIYDSNQKNIPLFERLRRLIFSNKKNYSYLLYDESKKYMKPYIGHDFKKILADIKSNTVISTRETIHLFLNDTHSIRVKNKIYFFHCPTTMIENVFPGILDEIKKVKLNKTVFVTEKNRQEYINQFNYSNYNNYLIIGNALERRNIRNINKIEAIDNKEKYYAIYLLRISQERIDDLNNLIEFAKYLKEKNIKNIVIDVFGDGDYVEEFIDILAKEDLFNIIHYKGKTNDSTYHIRRHDVLVDFSLNHSFGMTYIEGVLSGKMVYCMENAGSLEVMKEIPESFIKSHEDLVNKINNLPNITVEQLQENYRKIEEKYSRDVVASKFIDYLNQGEKDG